MQAIGTGSVASITRRAAERLRAGHLWVYRSDVERLAATPGDTVEPEPGALVSVTDSRGIPLGTALYSAGSEIALRMISRQLSWSKRALISSNGSIVKAVRIVKVEEPEEEG